MPTAIITGAGSGIGRATALRLAQMGYHIALVGRTLATLDLVVAEIRNQRGQAFSITADISNLEQVDAMVRSAHQQFGRIDVLINNAGLAPSIALAELTPQQWHEVLDTNLSSAFYTTRAVWPIMQQQHDQARAAEKPSNSGNTHAGADGAGGTIINISSMASKDPFPGLGAYACAKVALNMLTLVTAREGQAAGIRAICIAPAAVDTPMLHKLLGNQPINTDMMLQPDDVAATIAQILTGPLCNCSGDTLYLHRRPT